jgi:hypothetical protein
MNETQPPPSTSTTGSTAAKNEINKMQVATEMRIKYQRALFSHRLLTIFVIALLFFFIPLALLPLSTSVCTVNMSCAQYGLMYCTLIIVTAVSSIATMYYQANSD